MAEKFTETERCYIWCADRNPSDGALDNHYVYGPFSLDKARKFHQLVTIAKCHESTYFPHPIPLSEIPDYLRKYINNPADLVTNLEKIVIERAKTDIRILELIQSLK